MDQSGTSTILLYSNYAVGMCVVFKCEININLRAEGDIRYQAVWVLSRRLERLQ